MCVSPLCASHKICCVFGRESSHKIGRFFSVGFFKSLSTNLTSRPIPANPATSRYLLCPGLAPCIAWCAPLGASDVWRFLGSRGFGMVGQILATEVWMCHRLETPRCSVLRICLFQDTPKRVGPAEVHEYISP